MDVARLDPPVLPEGIVLAVLVVLVPRGVDAHEGPELDDVCERERDGRRKRI